MLAVVASDLRVNLIALGMIALGVALFVVTLRFWGSAGEDPEVLAPLEVMGDRRFARSDEAGRVNLLNEVRPEGAQPLEHISAPEILDHEPPQQERAFRDTFDHSDDGVDVVPQVIDPLLSQTKETK